MIYYDAPYVTISWDEQIKSVIVVWRAVATNEEFRDACSRIYTLLKTHQGSSTLADARKFKAISPEDQEWSVKIHLPRMVAIGFRKSAVVVPESQAAMMVLNRLVSMVGNQPVETVYFDTIEKAREWLLSNSPDA